jgi:Xaa-Pro aminopeptidase
VPGGHVRYLANFTVQNLHQAVVVPIKGEPSLVVQPGSRGCHAEWAVAEAWIEDVRSTPTDKWPPRQSLGPDIAQALLDNGAGSGRIGLCGGFPGVEKLGELLPGAQIVPGGTPDRRGTFRDLVERARAVKSEWEWERLYAAEPYAEVGMKAFMQAAVSGRKLVRAIAEGQWAAMREGADDFFVYMAASGEPPWLWWSHHGGRRFGANDLVSAETNARCEGYIAQIARSGAIGDPTAQQRLVTETAAAALAAMTARLGPGVTGDDLWQVGVEVVRSAGLSANSRYGHGMGLSMAETFDVMAGDENEAQPGWCVELHAGVMDPEIGQSALIGDQFRITEEGALPLSNALLPHDLKPPSSSRDGR